MPEENKVVAVLKALAALTDSQLAEVAQAINAESTSALRDEDTLEKIAKDRGINEQVIHDGFPALITVVHVARSKHKGQFREAVATLGPPALAEVEVGKLESFANATAEKIAAILEDIDATTSPSTTLNAYRGLSFRVISIAEFKNEFSIKDEPAKYEPIVKRQHPRALITLRLEDEDGTDRAIPFLASAKAIEHMLKYLQLGVRQLDAVTSSSEKAKK